MLNRHTMGFEILKKLREERNWTLQEVANKLNSYPQQISKYELGHTELTIEWIKKFAKVYEVNTSMIIGDENIPASSIKYSDVITQLILDASIKGKSPAQAVQEELHKFLGAIITDDMRQGLELDLERYKRLLQSLKKI